MFGVRRLLAHSVYIDFQLIQLRLLINEIICKYSKIETLIGEIGSKVNVKFTIYILP